VYEKVTNGTMSKSRGLKTYEKILRVKVRLLTPPRSFESLATLSRHLFDFVHATSGEDAAETTKTTESPLPDKETKSTSSPGSLTTTTTPLPSKAQQHVVVEKSPSDINLSLKIEQVRLECETEQYRAEIFERRYKQLKMTHNQELNLSNSKLSEVESRVQSLMNEMEIARNEWNEARESETRLAAALKESDAIIGNEANELSELRDSMKRVTARCKKESVAAKRWMSQRQIAHVAAKAAEAKTQKLKEEANEASTRADECDAKCRAAIKSSASTYDKFMHVSRRESDLQRANTKMEMELDAMREKENEMTRDDNIAKQRLKMALSEAESEVLNWRKRFETQQLRSESAEYELRQRVEKLGVDSSELNDLKRTLKEYVRGYWSARTSLSLSLSHTHTHTGTRLIESNRRRILMSYGKSCVDQRSWYGKWKHKM